jgi:hypothetical protein
MNPNPPVSVPAVAGFAQAAPLPPVHVVGARGFVAVGFPIWVRFRIFWKFIRRVSFMLSRKLKTRPKLIDSEGRL